jgi:hypothetical protein
MGFWSFGLLALGFGLRLVQPKAQRPKPEAIELLAFDGDRDRIFEADRNR